MSAKNEFRFNTIEVRTYVLVRGPRIPAITVSAQLYQECNRHSDDGTRPAVSHSVLTRRVNRPTESHLRQRI